MPTWGWNEYHSIGMPGEHTSVIDVAGPLTWGDVPLFRRIMRAVSVGRVPGHPNDRSSNSPHKAPRLKPIGMPKNLSTSVL